MRLEAYDACKFALAQLLRTMGAVIPKDRTELHDQIRNARIRLAEDRFNLAVVGRFSRGKSSLMNAMLRTERLPTGIEPLTSVITSVSYGTKEEVLIHHEGWAFPENTTIQSLPEFVTQHGNPGNEKKVQFAEIRMPAELLRQGFYFVDTPGLGSPIMENTETTKEFLPEIDAMILVSGFDDPIDDEEATALESALRAQRKAFVVLNKEDLVPEPERKRVCGEAAARLRRRFPDNTPEVFSLSALGAIQANTSQDAAALDRSHVPRFQTAVVDFLLQNKSSLILQQMYRRLCDIEEASPEVAATQEIRVGMETAKAMVDAFVSDHQSTDAPGESDWSEERPRLRGTCRVCKSMYEKASDFLRKYQYDLLIWSGTQQAHAAAGGFCPLHTWQYEALASPQGVSASQPDLVKRFAEQLRSLDLSDRDAASHTIARMLPGIDSCPLCRVVHEAESEMLTTAAVGLDTDPEKEATEFCVRHTGLLLPLLKSDSSAKRLVERTALLLHRTAQDMQRLAIKHEGSRRYLASEEEQKAYLRALLLLAGPRTLAMPVQVKEIA